LNREVKLPSGRVLKITPAPFIEARALYQVLLEEARGLRLDPQADVDVNLYKDLFCVALSSRKVEACVWECMKRATIDDVKITNDTFEKVEHRDDYIMACFEVAQDNVQPFMKSLFASYQDIIQKMNGALASRFQTTPSSSSTA
jgi:hypothetical protein